MLENLLNAALEGERDARLSDELRQSGNPEHNTMPRKGAVSIKDETQQKDGHTTGLLRESPRKDGTQKKESIQTSRINTNEKHSPSLPVIASQRRSNPEHNTMTRKGAVSIKDEKQEKDGHTTGLLRASPRKDGTQKNQSKRTV